jgi:hypothetical protein
MRPHAKFDEVMIVNPTEPNGGRVMRFYNGYAPAMGYYGYYGEPEQMYGQYDPGYGPVGYYAEDPYLSHQYPYGEVDPYGYGYGYGYYAVPEYPYGQVEPGYEPVGYYAAEDPYLAQEYPYGEVDPYGYYAEPEYPYGEYEPMEGYGQMPEMFGYDEYEPLEEYYPEPGTAGYVRQSAPSFNAGCPLPTNVSGFGEEEPLQGYVRPATVNASCGQFNPQPGAEPVVPETFKPLW